LFRKPEPIRGNMLNVGDAAAFIDPFVGDGISLALRSGTLAAECLACFLDGEDTLETAAERYQRQYNEQLLRVFRTSSKIRRLLALPYPARAALLMLFGNIPALTRYFVRRTR
jgi:flavin-dependent dehydrogenase